MSTLTNIAYSRFSAITSELINFPDYGKEIAMVTKADVCWASGNNKIHFSGLGSPKFKAVNGNIFEILEAYQQENSNEVNLIVKNHNEGLAIKLQAVGLIKSYELV